MRAELLPTPKILIISGDNITLVDRPMHCEITRGQEVKMGDPEWTIGLEFFANNIKPITKEEALEWLRNL